MKTEEIQVFSEIWKTNFIKFLQTEGRKFGYSNMAVRES